MTGVQTCALPISMKLTGTNTDIVSITLVMMSVFVPVSFMGGTAGTFYRQFGLTMAIAIGFSALNALTLSPALCAIFLKPHNGGHESLKERVGVAAKEARKIMIARYADSIGRLMRPGITLLFVTVAILGMIFGLFSFSEHPILCSLMIIISVLKSGLRRMAVYIELSWF